MDIFEIVEELKLCYTNLMKIIVASVNPQKIKAVSDMIPKYDFLTGASVEGVNVPSGVSDQPKSIEETVQGAVNRAKAAFGNGADYSFGIESGLMAVPQTKCGIMDVCICAIYDGKNIHLGLSSAFEPPQKVVDLMYNGMDMTQACVEVGLTNNPKLGASEGLIGILTHGRLDRLGYTAQAVTTALIHLENAHLFEK